MLLCAAVSLCAVPVGVGGHITVYSVQCIHSSVSVACAHICCSIYTNTTYIYVYGLHIEYDIVVIMCVCMCRCVCVCVYVYKI